MSSTYSISIRAGNSQDAIDIAKRRARADGYAPLDGQTRVVTVVPVTDGKAGLFAVELQVLRQ